MNIIFDSVRLNNFLSFEDAEVNLNTNGYTLVSGINKNPDDLAKSNGSGKSSLWEAITWAITGETIRGTKEVKRIGVSEKSPCSVELVFTIDSNNYKIIRSKDPTSLKLFINGEDVSGKGIRDTQQILENRLPDLNASLIGSVIILGQGLPQRFTNNSPSGRKEVLEKLSKSDFMILDLKDRVTKRRYVITDKMEELDREIYSSEGRVGALLSEIDNIEKRISDLNEMSTIEDDITKCVEEEKRCKSRLEECELELHRIEELVGEWTETKAEYERSLGENIQKVRDKYSEEISEKKLAISKLEFQQNAYRQEIEKLLNIKDVCPTCGQKIPGVVKPDTSELSEKLSVTEKECLEQKCLLQNVQLTLDSDIKQCEERYKSLIDNAVLQIEAFKKRYDSNDTAYKNALLNYQKVNKERIVLESRRESFGEKIDDLKNLIDNYKNEIEKINEKILYSNNERGLLSKHLEVLIKFDTVLKRDFRGYLLSGIIDYISKKSKEYSQIVFETDKIDFELDGNNIDISYNEKSYESLSGGEKQKVDLIVQFAIRDMLCKYLDFSSNILVLDEIFDNLDSVGCQNILNLISAKLNDVQSIFIITHHTDIPVPNDDEIIIEKGVDNISRIKSV